MTNSVTEFPISNHLSMFPHFQMRHFQSGGDPSKSPSELLIEWTNQHGCGTTDAQNPNKLNCDLVAQFTCGDHLKDGTDSGNLQFQGPRSG